MAAGGLDGSGFRDLGLDVKYGLASGLNLDVTLNTDFAQVEVDEQQVNLTRFPLFFPREARLLPRERRHVQRRSVSRGSAASRTCSSPGASGCRTTRPAGPHRRGHARLGQGGAPQRRGDEHHHPGGVRQPRRQLLRRALQPRHPRAVEGRRHRHRQELRQRRPFQPDAGRRHHPGRAPQLHDQRVPGQDGDRALRGELHDEGPLSRRAGEGHGGVRPRHVAQPVVEHLRRVHRPAGELQRRGRLRAPHRHPHLEVPRRVGSPPGALGHPHVRPDVEHHLHHRSEQPAADAAHPPHDRDLLRERLVDDRCGTTTTSSSSTSRSPSTARGSRFRPARTASASGTTAIAATRRAASTARRATRRRPSSAAPASTPRPPWACGPRAGSPPSCGSTATTWSCRGATSSPTSRRCASTSPSRRR